MKRPKSVHKSSKQMQDTHCCITQVARVVHFAVLVMRDNACAHGEDLVEDIVQDNLAQWDFCRIGNALSNASLLLGEI